MYVPYKWPIDSCTPLQIRHTVVSQSEKKNQTPHIRLQKSFPFAMTRLHLISAVLLSVIIASGALTINLDEVAERQQNRNRCRRGNCRFVICRGTQTSFLAAPNTALSSPICRRDQNIENILSTGQAQIKGSDGNLIPISEWRPDGLEVPFTSGALFADAIPGRDLSGLARLPAVGNQNDFLDQACVVVPIRSYERIVNGKKRVRQATSSRDCLSVGLESPTIFIEAFWTSGDDMDLAVIEPDNVRVNNKNRTSSCGRLIRDQNVDACGLFNAGQERIIYRLPCDGFKKGRYRAVLKHTGNCGSGPSSYELRVVVNGRLKAIKKGVSNADGGKRVTSLRFMLE